MSYIKREDASDGSVGQKSQRSFVSNTMIDGYAIGTARQLESGAGVGWLSYRRAADVGRIALTCVLLGSRTRQGPSPGKARCGEPNTHIVHFLS